MHRFLRNHGLSIATALLLGTFLVIADIDISAFRDKGDGYVPAEAWFFIGNLIGYIIGVVLMFPINYHYGLPSPPPFSIRELRSSVIPLVIELSRIDGQDLRIEEANFHYFVNKYYTEREAKKIAAIFKSFQEKRITTVGILSDVDENFSFDSKKTLLYLLVNIAVADRFLTVTEENYLNEITAGLSIPKRYVEHFLSQRNFTTSKKHSSQEKSRRRASVKTFSHLELACQIIGVSTTADVDIIKKEYRVLVKKFHPDRLVKASQIEKDMASEQFQKIQEAYEFIKEQKGFK